MMKYKIKSKFIGSIDSQKVEVSTNINQMNPLIASAILIPIIRYKKKKKHDIAANYPLPPQTTPELIVLPWILPSPVSSSNAFVRFYQRMILNLDQNKLTIRMDWKDNIKYSMPPARSKKKIALKLDGLMSIAAMKYYEEEAVIDPYMIAFSEDEAEEKLTWAKQFWFWDDEKPITVFVIDYGINTPHIDPRPYENWMFATIASIYYAHVWLPFPGDEISDYYMECNDKLFNEGPEWMSRIYQSMAVVETPWPEGNTRTRIIKEMLDKKLIPNENVILDSMRCTCGKCLECFFNMAMLENLGIDYSEKFPYGFNNPEMITKFRTMGELGKLNKNMTDELKNILEA